MNAMNAIRQRLNQWRVPISTVIGTLVGLGVIFLVNKLMAEVATWQAVVFSVFTLGGLLAGLLTRPRGNGDPPSISGPERKRLSDGH